MRTTISVDDNLLRAAKRAARRAGVTLGEFISMALRRELARSPRSDDEVEIPVFTGGTGMRPGIDATSTAALLEALDRDLPVEKLT